MSTLDDQQARTAEDEPEPERTPPSPVPDQGWLERLLAAEEHREPVSMSDGSDTEETCKAPNSHVEPRRPRPGKQRTSSDHESVTTHLTPDAARYLDFLRACPSERLARREAGVTPRQVTRWRRNTDFTALEREAGNDAGQMLLAAGYQRGVFGVLKPVYQMGVCVGHVREYSDKLAEVLLKGMLPTMFRPEPEQTAGVQRIVLGTPEQVAEVVRRLSPTGQPALPPPTQEPAVS